MKNYLCSECKTLIQSDSSPSQRGCPKSSSHNWENLGNVGNTNYQCRNCGVVVRSDWSPSQRGCPSGSSHNWSKL